MKFEDARTVEMLTYQLKMSDAARSGNRARINDLFNGAPPYFGDEAKDAKINVNDLSSTRAGHNARAQYYNAFLRPDRFFTCQTDMGKRHKRSEYNTIVTNNAARIMKRSMHYFECLRSKFALNVLHGIGPSAWEDREKWCPDPLGVEDVLIPADTLLTMKNLPFFAISRSYTAPELIRLTSGPKVDPAWNMDLVNRCIEWIDREAVALMGTNWPAAMALDKLAERRMDSGYYAGDKVPTIDTFDFYFWSEEGKTSGWRRRIILDAWGSPNVIYGAAGAPPRVDMDRRKGKLYDSLKEDKDGFLFNPGKRKYADHLSELISFQFADLSAVGPFRYHSVRSLGKLLYAVCHLQNRLRCSFMVSVFEALMQYFRVANEDEFQRALKIEMIDRGFIDNSVKMVPAAERWQVNANLVQLGLMENRQLIEESSASYSQNTNFSSDRTEKTKFQVMAELQGMTQMLNAGLLQAYAYQTFEYREIFRRLMRTNSRDPDVKEFRAACLRQGVPEKILVPEAWDIQPMEVMGAGNSSLQLVIAQQLLDMLPLFDGAGRQEAIKDSVFAITQDATRTKLYVGEGPRPISNSAHDAQTSLGSILQGVKVNPVPGQNTIEVIEVWLAEMEKLIVTTAQTGGVPTIEGLRGMQNLMSHIAAQIVTLAADKNEKERVKQYSDALMQAGNAVTMFAQRLQEKMQAENGQSGIDPETLGQIQADIIKAQAKAANTRESHAQRTAQRQLQFEQQMRQRQQEHALDMRERVQDAQVNAVVEGAKVAAKIERDRARPAPEPTAE